MVNGVVVSTIRQFSRDEFEEKEFIGEGCFANVYRGRLIENDKEIAIKKFINITSIDMNNEYIVKKSGFIKEATILKLIQDSRNKNLIEFFGICVEDDYIAIITKYYSGGNLKEVLDSQDIPIQTMLSYAKNITNGLSGLCHCEPRVIHRDLKPENILIDENNELVLADFGLSTTLSSNKKYKSDSSLRCTPLFASPEILCSNSFNEKADIYSAALIFHYMITQEEPYQSYQDLMHFKRDIVLRSLRPCTRFNFDNPFVNNHLKSLLQSMWQRNSIKRSSLDNILLKLVTIESLI
eukprot:TRINITY_DN41_c2_g2_i1.p1 TRINITY_DN41_c2_g2~~TRINITY_DN41_c2_g2_i1.p1  ORF type:complete len:295 (-),score=60.04 TRINITY_DN41_c2_g2_i1:320-1204(-)